MPKAVRHTQPLRGRHRQWVDALGLTDADRFQVTTPPSHILGLNLLAAADAGATVRLHPRFDLDEVLHRIASERMTLEMVVAPIARHGEPPEPRGVGPVVAALHPVGCDAGDRGRRPQHHRADRRRFLAGYGASELPVISVNPVRQPDRWRLDAVGLPVPGRAARRRPDDGRAAADRRGGRDPARSPSVMAGYLPDEANAEAFVGDGWYRTGDVGFVEPRAGSTSPTAPRR